MENKINEIKKYWDDRASQFQGNTKATTDDIYLRELEIMTIIQTLNQIGITKNKTVLDIGCGDGYSIIKIAQALPDLTFVGIDYSDNMIKSALGLLSSKPDLSCRIRFFVEDVTKLDQFFNNVKYDVVISDRCLINLDSSEKQYSTISRIAEFLNPNGYFILIENFIEGHESMNKARHDMGLVDIPVRWHNLFFREPEFIEQVKKNFEIKEFKDFSSSYYFATRIIYSKLCQMKGEEPNYSHEMHRLAIQLPWVGQFSPIRMVILQKKSSDNVQN